MSRRRFVSCAAGAVWSLGRPSPPAPTRTGWVVLDLKDHCRLRESVAGYRSALGLAFGVPPFRSAGLIVPAAVKIPPPAVRAIVNRLRAGATVILESGAAFASSAEFAAHRDMLRDTLQVGIESPLELWPRSIPYVDYAWPSPTRVRDFSRVVPLGRQEGEIIARADGLPVALKRACGGGTLIFLGSPLGPAIWAGDAEARRWLCDVVATYEGRRATANR